MIGKVVGGVLGLLLGGPWGGALGLVLGHAFDSRPDTSSQGPGGSTPFGEEAAYFGALGGGVHGAFLTAVTVLGAKLAKADGRVSREEVATFRKVFPIPDVYLGAVGALFDRARASSEGYEPYALHLAHLFAHKPQILEEVLTGLFRVAMAERGAISSEEAIFLERVGKTFGFSADDFIRVAARSGVRIPNAAAPPPEDPYAILGVTPEADAAALKRAYRTLIRQHHPDRLIAQGLPSELVAQATEKMKRLNGAYERICQQRGFA